MGISNIIHSFSDTKWLLPFGQFKKLSEVVKYKWTEGNISKFIEIKKSFLGDNEPDFSIPLGMRGNTLIFPITGTLVPKASRLDAMCGLISSIQLQEDLKLALETFNPSSIIYVIDSPGGAVTAIPELGDLIHSVSKDISSIAFTNTMMASGGFWLGSAAGRIAATRSAILGSVGVFREVIKIQDDGIDVHVFQAGDKKTFGHPNIPLTEAESIHFQESVDQTYELFLSTVSSFRNIDKEALRATQGSHGEAEFNSIFVDDIVTSIDDLF